MMKTFFGPFLITIFLSNFGFSSDNFEVIDNESIKNHVADMERIRAMSNEELLATPDDKPEELLPTYFTPDELNLVRIYGEILFEKTTENDVVLFVGRSPWIISEYWRFKEGSRHFFNISFSGQPYTSTNTSMDFLGNSSGKPEKEDFKAYLNYLKSINLIEAIKRVEEQQGQIILVDETITGNGMIQFSILLKDLGLLNESSRILFAFINSFFDQETLENPHYSFNLSLKKYVLPFQYELFPFSFATLQDKLKINREDQVFTSAKMSAFEFSIPGLGKFGMKDWRTINPLNFEVTENVEVVLRHTKQMWATQASDNN